MADTITPDEQKNNIFEKEETPEVPEELESIEEKEPSLEEPPKEVEPDIFDK